MPFYLIGIKKRRWDRDGEFWLIPNLIPADVYRDLRVERGYLSLWYIQDDKSNLNDVITALAVTRDTPDIFEYCLFQADIINAVGLATVITPGDTPLSDVNHWHRDLTTLTVDGLTNLIKAIFDVMEKVRVPKSIVKNLILQAFEANRIDILRVKEQMQGHLTNSTTPPNNT